MLSRIVPSHRFIKFGSYFFYCLICRFFSFPDAKSLHEYIGILIFIYSL